MIHLRYILFGLLTLGMTLIPTRALCAMASANDSTEVKREAKDEVVAIKNNLLYDAAATPNLQLEVKMAPKWSMEFGVGFNPFPLDDTRFPKWRHLMVSVAPRYWFCNVFNRGFVSINAAYAMFNVAGDAYPVSWMYKEVKDGRYEGHAAMAGASGGWHFPIKPYFSIELEGGVDAGYAWYRQYECKHCGDMQSQGGRWLVLPKIGVNLVFPLGGDEESLARRCDCEKLETAAEAAVATAAASETDTIAQEDRFAPSDTLAREEPEQAVAVAEEPAAKDHAPKREEQAEEEAIAKAEPVEEMPTEEPATDEPVEEVVAHKVLSLGPRNGYLYFDVDVSKMDRSFLENDELMADILDALGEILEDTTLRISRIEVTGFASFDGRLAYNIRLAAARAKTIKEQMQAAYPQLADSLFDITNGGESWEDLREMLEKVDFEGRDEVFAIMDEEPDLDLREKKIKALHGGATYRYMRDELKHIMRNLGRITVNIERK